MSNLDYKAAYRRNLPHLQPPGATFFVTFRLAGSLPQSVIQQWHEEGRWLERNPFGSEQHRLQFERRWFAKFEALLDAGNHGPLWLKNDCVAEQISESLHFRDGKYFRLDSFTIMPNHVHTLFKPLPIKGANVLDSEEIEYYSLGSIMHSLKGYTAYKANRLLGLEGQFWAHESYDHWVRNSTEWFRIMAYVLNNPVKAGFVEKWSEWPWSYRRMPQPQRKVESSRAR